MIILEKFYIGNGQLLIENGRVKYLAYEDLTIEEFLALAKELSNAIDFIELNEDEIRLGGDENDDYDE